MKQRISTTLERIDVGSSPVDIYAYPDVVFIDRNVSGCITLARGVRKVVYGDLSEPSLPALEENGEVKPMSEETQRLIEKDWMDPQSRTLLLNVLGQEEVAKIDELYDRIAEGEEIMNYILCPFLKMQPDLLGYSEIGCMQFADWWREVSHDLS